MEMKMKFLPTKTIELCMEDLHKILKKYSADNRVISSLEVMAASLASLLDIYSAPNEKNRHGMCDDPVMFRRMFCMAILKCEGTGCDKETELLAVQSVPPTKRQRRCSGAPKKAKHVQ